MYLEYRESRVRTLTPLYKYKSFLLYGCLFMSVFFFTLLLLFFRTLVKRLVAAKEETKQNKKKLKEVQKNTTGTPTH